MTQLYKISGFYWHLYMIYDYPWKQNLSTNAMIISLLVSNLCGSSVMVFQESDSTGRPPSHYSCWFSLWVYQPPILVMKCRMQYSLSWSDDSYVKIIKQRKHFGRIPIKRKQHWKCIVIRYRGEITSVMAFWDWSPFSHK